MSYKKYIKRDGKLYGPYIYKSKRIGNKVVSHYVGQEKNVGQKRNLPTKKIFISILLGIFLIGLFYAIFNLNFSFTGKVTLQTNSVYLEGEQIYGTLKIILKPGELLPANTLVRSSLGNAETNFLLSDLISSEQSNGIFYVEGSNLAGTGIGYGIIGEKIISPDIYFSFKIIEQPVNISESNDTEVNIEPETNFSTPEITEVVPDSEITSETEEEIIVDDTQNTETNPDTETPNSDQTTSAPPSQEAVSETSSSPEETLVSSAPVESSPEPSITGAVIVNDIIEGSVSAGNQYEYTLLPGQSAELIPESVNINGEPVNSSLIQFEVQAGKVIVNTNHASRESGFGSEYNFGNSMEINLDLTDINISAEPGTLKIDLLYENNEIISISQDISVIPNGTIQNETIQNETVQNMTIQNETIQNTTIVPEGNETEENITISSLEFLNNISDLTIKKNENISLDLNSYFLNADYYNITGVENISFILENNNLLIIPDINFTGIRTSKITASRIVQETIFNESSNESYDYSRLETIESNEFSIIVSESNLSIKTRQHKARIGEKVKWTKEVSLESPENITIELPKEAENINILKNNNEVIASSAITGNVVMEISGDGFFTKLWNSISKAITGRVVENIDPNVNEENNQDIKEVVINDSSLSYIIEYETPAPYAVEGNISGGKEIVVVGPDNLHYQDITAYTSLEQEAKSEQIRLYWITEENYTDENNETKIRAVKVSITPDMYDDNENGLIDYMEWNVPHLSNQTYQLIIEISRAVHLDENRTFIEDVYDYVKAVDGINVSIPNNDYVRVEFEQELTNQNDITVYAFGEGSSIEVYGVDGTDKIAEINNINQAGWYKTYLSSLSGSLSEFDLKVIGNVTLDYIVDPVIGSGSINFTNPTPVTGNNNTQNHIINVSLILPSNNLKSLNFSFNNTNFSVYSSNLIFMSNFNNNSAVGDGANNISDLSSYSNTLYPATSANDCFVLMTNATCSAQVGCTSSYSNCTDWSWDQGVCESYSGCAYDVGNSVCYGSYFASCTGTYYSPIIIYAAGKYGNALSCDGSSTTYSTSAIHSTAANYSYSFWVYPTDTYWDAMLLSLAGGTNNNFRFGVSSDNWQIQVPGGSMYGIAPATANTWTYVVINKFDSYFDVYINGTNYSSEIALNGFSQENITLCSRGSDQYFSGRIDNFRYYNKSLSDKEIIEDYQSNFYKNNLSEWVYTSAKNNLPWDTNYSYFALACDSSNNCNSTEVRELNITDPDAPFVAFVSPLNNSVYSVNRILVNITNSSDTRATWWYNGSVNTTYLTANMSLVSAGLNTFIAYANDTKGNVNSSYLNFSVVLTNPNLTVNHPSPNNSQIISGGESNTLLINFSSQTDTGIQSSFIDFNKTLVLWLRYNDNTGLNDSSSYRANGTNYGSVYNFNGKFGGAYYFNTSGYQNFTGNSRYNLSSSFTISFWANMDDKTRTQRVLGTSTSTNGIGLGTNGGWGSGLRINYYAQGTNYNSNAITGVNNNEWHHYAIVRNGTNVSYYVDKVEFGSSANANPYGDNSNIYVGRRQNGEFFKGYIDDVQIHSRALSLAEINSLYNSSQNQYYNNYTNLALGNYTYQAYTQDYNGNLNASLLINFELRDTTSPIVTVISPIAGNYFYNNIFFNLTLNENGSVCLVSLDNFANNYSMTKLSNSRTFSYTYNNAPMQNNTAKFSCNDSYGNVNSTAFTTFNLNFSYPQVEFISPTPASGVNASHGLTINASISQTTSNLGSVIFYWNNTNISVFDSSLKAYYKFDNNSVIGDTSYLVKDSGFAGKDLVASVTSQDCSMLAFDNASCSAYLPQCTPTFYACSFNGWDESSCNALGGNCSWTGSECIGTDYSAFNTCSGTYISQNALNFVTGKYGKALQFNNDYANASIGSDSSVNTTFSFWFYPPSSCSGYGRLISFGNNLANQ